MVEFVHSSVSLFPFDGMDVVGPTAFHVHQVKKPGTVGEFVDHTHGEEIFRARPVVHNSPD